jgi:hypothetical protein
MKKNRKSFLTVVGIIVAIAIFCIGCRQARAGFGLVGHPDVLLLMVQVNKDAPEAKYFVRSQLNNEQITSITEGLEKLNGVLTAVVFDNCQISIRRNPTITQDQVDRSVIAFLKHYFKTSGAYVFYTEGTNFRDLDERISRSGI